MQPNANAESFDPRNAKSILNFTLPGRYYTRDIEDPADGWDPKG